MRVGVVDDRQSPAVARTDLWARGAILYEMVTGKHAFEGTSAVSLMTAILDQLSFAKIPATLKRLTFHGSATDTSRP